MVGLGGLEPPTSPLSGARSSHLSYRPIETWQQYFLLYSTRQILAILLLPNCPFCVPLQTLSASPLLALSTAGVLIGKIAARNGPAHCSRRRLNLHPPCVARKAFFGHIVCLH